MHNNYKRLSLIILLKRRRKNSVILKKAKHLMAKELGMSTYLFCKLITEAKTAGYLVETKKHYKIIAFKTILKDVHKDSGLMFLQHQILKGESKDFKEILSQVEKFYLVDNIHRTQQWVSEKKSRDILLVRKIQQTEKKRVILSKKEMMQMKRLIKKYGCWESAAKTILTSLDYNQDTITSARHVSSKIGVSRQKANILLNSLEDIGYVRSIRAKWFNGCSIENFERLRERFPKATIYPLISLGKTKVCFGSSISELARPSLLVSQYFS